MKTSSKVMLIASFCVLVLLGASYYQLVSASMPEMTEADARTVLEDLRTAFRQGKVSAIMSHIAPDAQIGGKTTRQIESLLARGMQFIKQPEAQYSDLIYTREGETVTLDLTVTVRDLSSGETLYHAPVTITFTRRASVHAGGLFTTYDWKITNVVASIPSE